MTTLWEIAEALRQEQAMKRRDSNCKVSALSGRPAGNPDSSRAASGYSTKAIRAASCGPELPALSRRQESQTPGLP